MEFCSYFEQIADPPNFLRELALKFCLRQKSLKLRHSSNWAANLFKIWQNSNAALSVAYLFFIIYQKSRVWTITRLENLRWRVWRTIMDKNYDFTRRKTINLSIFQTARQIGVVKSLSSSVNEYKDCQPTSYNIHTV